MAAVGTRSRATQAASTGRRAAAEKTQATTATRGRKAGTANGAAGNDIVATPKKRGRPAASANGSAQTSGTATTTRGRRATGTVGGSDMAAACTPGKGGMSKGGGSKGQPAAIKKATGGTPKKTATAGAKKGK